MSAPRPALSLAFRPRPSPLTPLAVAARGISARALAARLLARDDAALGRLAGVAGTGLLLALGEADDLPWVDGALYLGRDPEAPALLLPTALEPLVPASLVERAVRARAPAAAAPIALLVDAAGEPAAIADASSARPIERAALLRWLEGGRRRA